MVGSIVFFRRVAVVATTGVVLLVVMEAVAIIWKSIVFCGCRKTQSRCRGRFIAVTSDTSGHSRNEIPINWKNISKKGTMLGLSGVPA